jgi:hypothetical protein
VNDELERMRKETAFDPFKAPSQQLREGLRKLARSKSDQPKCRLRYKPGSLEYEAEVLPTLTQSFLPLCNLFFSSSFNKTKFLRFILFSKKQKSFT